MRRVRFARYVAGPCMCLAVGLWAAPGVAQPTPRPPASGTGVKYPTMLKMTFPEFEAAAQTQYLQQRSAYKAARIPDTVTREPRAQAQPGSSSRQRQMVLRYFRDVVDGGNADVLTDLVTADCIIHRPDGELKGIPAFRGWLSRARASWATFRTQVHDVIEAGDRVVVRLTHEATGTGPYRFRIGTHDVKNKTTRWDSIAIFRFENSKIAEEWVSRDELGMLLDAGVLRRGNGVR
jgi:predicted ester cyclase